MSAPRDPVDAMLARWARERPDLDTTGMRVVLRILMLAGVLEDRLKETLAPTGLVPWEFDVLSALLRHPEGLTSTELCASAQLTSGAMTHRIDRLEERGLVRRKPSDQDRRSTTISLTPDGRTLVERAIGIRMADALECLRSLDAREREELTRLLRTLSLDLRPPRGLPPRRPDREPRR